VLPIYVVLSVPPSLAGVVVVLAVIRAKKEDLPDIVRALMRIGPRDDKRDDDGVNLRPHCQSPRRVPARVSPLPTALGCQRCSLFPPGHCWQAVATFGTRDVLEADSADGLHIMIYSWTISKVRFLDSTRNADLQELAHSNHEYIRMRVEQRKALRAGRR
jgi:hypothetical protein